MGSFSKLQWMDAVRQCTDIPAEQRLVIEDIGSTADQDGLDAWRDNKSVADRLKVHSRTVTRARENAARHSLWIETRPADNKHTTRYRLLMPSVGGDSTVTPEPVGVTAESAWGDSTVQLGRQHSPLGVTPQSPASGISSGSSSDASSGAPHASNAGARDTYAVIEAFTDSVSTNLRSGMDDPWSVAPDEDHHDYDAEECA